MEKMVSEIIEDKLAEFFGEEQVIRSNGDNMSYGGMGADLLNTLDAKGLAVVPKKAVKTLEETFRDLKETMIQKGMI